MDSPFVQLRSVKRHYRAPGGGRLLALDLRELRLGRGERLAILGPNGAGKTTLLHLVAGLLRPDEGRVMVGGQDLSGLREPALDRFRARTIGYLLQGDQLIDGLTAQENIMAALLFAGKSRRQQRDMAQVLLARFGLQHRASHLPAALSGGERQRVALARALANDPPLILADEPTARLDTESASQLVQMLNDLCLKDGRTLMMVTHRPSEVAQGMRTIELRAPQREEAP